MAKTKKAPVAKSAGFSDKDGYPLAIGDQVRFEHQCSKHSGRHGILTAIHPRESQDIGPVATVEFLYDSQWQAAPAMPAFEENLVFISREGFVVGERARVVWADDKLRPEAQAYTGREGRVSSVLENIPFPDIVQLQFDDATLEDRDFQATDLLRTAMAPALPEPPPIEEESDLPFLNGQAQAEMRNVLLDEIIVTSNTRKVFDDTALAELANSIKAQGVIAPITVRPHATEAGKFELVAGERRYRASKLAEQTTIPAVIRTLTDREFLEVQLLENLQRVDVRPADEAEAFAKLLKNGYSAEEIGLKVGKGAKFVAQRAKLAALMPFWFDALQEERLPLVAATEIARLPDESQTRLEEVAMRDYSLKQPSAVFKAEWIKSTIKSYVLRELNAAAFPKHDAKLYAAAGACTTCPKRSGAVRQLFDEEELKHDYCLDGACFEHKKEAFVERQCASLRQQTGAPAVRISTDYYQVPKGTLDCYSYQEAKEGAKGAVQAVVVKGPEMGQLKWVTVRAGSGNSKSEADKAADAKRLRTERLTKTHRALIAEKLTIDLPAAMATQSPVYESILTYLLLEECSSAKETLAYLRESWGWEPGEAALKDDYNDKDARGFRPWKRFVLEMVGPLSLEQKLEMYLALKVRHRMHYDYEDRQFTIAKLVAGHGYPELAAEAEQAVEARYYTRKGKKQEATA